LAAHQKGLPVHIYLDRSQEVGKTEMPLVEQLVNAGTELAVGMPPAGTKFICFALNLEA